MINNSAIHYYAKKPNNIQIQLYCVVVIDVEEKESLSL